MTLRSAIRYGMMSVVAVVFLGLSLVWFNQERLEQNMIEARSAAQLNFLARSIYAEGLQMGQATRNIILSPAAEKAYANHAEAAKNFAKLVDGVRSLIAQSSETSALSATLSEVQKICEQDLALQRDLHGLAKSGNSLQAIEKLNKKETPLWRQCKAEILKLGDQAEGVSGAMESRAASRSKIQKSIMALLCLVMIALPLGIYFVMNRLLRQLLQHMRGLVRTVTDAAESSRQMQTTSEKFSSSANEQASALQETVSSIEEISAMIQQNSDNSTKSQAISQDSQQSAVSGRASVESMRTSIDEINASITRMMSEVESENQELEKIVSLISEIAEKTKVINDIVFQTKLLSFNASVEAARAGEQGKGFAVVAEEVGNLAQVSGNAAKEISEILERSTRTVEQIIAGARLRVQHLVDEGKLRGKKGIEVAETCSQALDLIVKNVSSVDERVHEISTACNEQSHGIDQITKAMGRLDQVTQENAAASCEASQAAAQMKRQADDINEVVDRLIALVGFSAEAEVPTSRNA